MNRVTEIVMQLDEAKQQAVWVAHSLFNRNKVSGSCANLSFRCDDKIYITASGTCFGILKESDFAVVDLEGNSLSRLKPSIEFPLHLSLYRKSADIGAVLHTHSVYSVLWSFHPAENESDCVPEYTPYLKMKVGTVGLIPYEKPGTAELFRAFQNRLQLSDAYLLKQHGPVVCGKNMMDAFYGLEELEESCRIAWELRGLPRE
ncbi:class II aldolase/adducin family protein [Caproiciproducens faecalis]|uniref:Class II aldolase/adducin family protein n=1 Tax=Caproiciproducens faecalis TaxID=2820301 RepID=A0ABS7DJH5_9FIRM|nr:class II aldolase/adducin family protein [Caproiciproducens faecalis]MBW7571373.1 class II aldolase/adducin family protein [Caproiciproducens faecalis]